MDATTKWQPAAVRAIRQEHPAMLHPATSSCRRNRQAGQIRRAYLEQPRQVQVRRRHVSDQRRRETIWGVKCYKDFETFLKKPDHVLVLVRRVSPCSDPRRGSRSARSATIVTSGFSELQDEESQRLAVELDQAIERTGLASWPEMPRQTLPGERIFTNIDEGGADGRRPVAVAGQSGRW